MKKMITWPAILLGLFLCFVGMYNAYSQTTLTEQLHGTVKEVCFTTDNLPVAYYILVETSDYKYVPIRINEANYTLIFDAMQDRKKITCNMKASKEYVDALTSGDYSVFDMLRNEKFNSSISVNMFIHE